MISDLAAKIAVFFKNIGHAVLGILSELALAWVFILLGFIVCVFWWGVIR